MRKLSTILSVATFVFVLGVSCDRALAADPNQASPAASQSGADNRYGFLGLLDRRSTYGQYWFPEPLRADEADVDNEVRVDWFSGEHSGRQDDELKIEIEKAFGLFTFEVAPSWQSDRTARFNRAARRTDRGRDVGLGNVEFGGRFPFYEYVSPDRSFETTFVFGMEVTVPTRTSISKDWELVPKVFNLTRIGDHFAVQAGLGDSVLVGPEARGLSTLEYGVTFAYELTKHDLPIPGVLTTWPIVEFDGEYTLNHEDRGHNELSATVGFRFNFETIKGLPAQPRIGLGYTFPLDEGARDEFRWGLVVSLIFEY